MLGTAFLEVGTAVLRHREEQGSTGQHRTAAEGSTWQHRAAQGSAGQLSEVGTHGSEVAKHGSEVGVTVVKSGHTVLRHRVAHECTGQHRVALVSSTVQCSAVQGSSLRSDLGTAFPILSLPLRPTSSPYKPALPHSR
jgi:hypothetical protein